MKKIMQHPEFLPAVMGFSALVFNSLLNVIVAWQKWTFLDNALVSIAVPVILIGLIYFAFRSLVKSVATISVRDMWHGQRWTLIYSLGLALVFMLSFLVEGNADEMIVQPGALVIALLTVALIWWAFSSTLLVAFHKSTIKKS